MLVPFQLRRGNSNNKQKMDQNTKKNLIKEIKKEEMETGNLIIEMIYSYNYFNEYS